MAGHDIGDHGRVRFADRASAGRALGERVAAHLDANGQADGRPLVLALPRGGVPVGYEVARAIGGDLDVIVVRKIGLPARPEFGVGAVAEDGAPVLDHATLSYYGLSAGDLAPTIERERSEVRRRINRYRGNRPGPAVSRRACVIVDDGMARGVTAQAAVRSLRRRGPSYLVFAAPVCAAQSAAALSAAVDAVVCLQRPAEFMAVGEWYDDFSQLDDDDVDRILAMARAGAGQRHRRM